MDCPKALPKGGFVFSPSPIEVVISNSVESAAYSVDQADVLMDQTREIIKANLSLK
jgi:hypothetical protein